MESGAQKLPESSFIRDTWGNLRNALIGCGAAVLFGLAVLFMSIFSATGIGAHESGVPHAHEEVTALVNYYLPYPGVLPDSPLYKAKMARDFVRAFFTFSTTDKAELELMYADKRINAAWILLEGGKTGLAIETATKAEKYLQTSVNRAVTAYEQGQDTKSILLTQVKAVAKHQELLDNMMKRVTGDDKSVLELSAATTKTLAEKLSQIDFSK